MAQLFLLPNFVIKHPVIPKFTLPNKTYIKTKTMHIGRKTASII